MKCTPKRTEEMLQFAWCFRFLVGSSLDFDFPSGLDHGWNGEKNQGFMEDLYQELKESPHGILCHNKTDMKHYPCRAIGN